MDDGESSAPNIRKRTESNGGSSDSELSEGWNIIDQTDVTNHDVPSSDGESVEVIDTEDESRENEVEGDTQLTPVADTAVLSHTESDVPAIPHGTPQEEMFDSSFRWFLIYATAAVLVSNFAFMVAENALTWNADLNIEAPSFLRDLPTTSKLLNGNNLIQNIPWADKEEAMVEILEDHGVNRNPRNQNDKRSQSYEINTIQTKPSVERFDKHKNNRFNKQPNEKYNKHPNEKYNKQPNEKYNKQQNENLYKHLNEETQKYSYHNFEDHKIRTYFKTLSEVTTSSETKDKLNQVLLILDALYIGLNDLEEVVTENSELQSVLKKQKHKLSQVLTEMEYGVSKSLDRVATNILNKVRKLERRFEHQWCELERHGHQDKLKGLFYDCQGNEDTFQKNEHQTDTKRSEEIKTTKETPPVRKASEIDMKWNSYQYQVDKDSPGKEHSNAHVNEVKEVDDYYTLVKSEMQNTIELSKEHENTQHNSDPGDFSPTEENNKSKYANNIKISDSGNGKRESTDNEGKQYYNKGKHYYDKGKQYNDNGKHYADKGKLNDAKEKHYDNEGKHYNDKRRHYDDKTKHMNEKGLEGAKFSESKRKDDRRSFSEDKRKHTKRFETYKSTEQHSNKDHTNNREGQIKSEKSFPNSEPELIRKYLKESCEKGRNKFKNMYEKLKSFIDSKLRVPKKMFDSLFAKYCQVNDDSFKWEKRFNREHPKGDFSGKNKNFFKDDVVIGDNVNKNVRIVDISEVGPEDEAADPVSDNTIMPNNQPRQWVFSYDEPSHDNKSNVTGDWFFKAGESRSKMRWSHHRGDWWFERASHRRAQSGPTNWFSGRRKNWYFRRAWARQNCRHSPHDNWCDFSEEETVTVPNPSTNFR